MPTNDAAERFERIRERAEQLRAALDAEPSPEGALLLLLHALTQAHLEGMDVATAICNDAIERVVLRRTPSSPVQ